MLRAHASLLGPSLHASDRHDAILIGAESAPDVAFTAADLLLTDVLLWARGLPRDGGLGWWPDEAGGAAVLDRYVAANTARPAFRRFEAKLSERGVVDVLSKADAGRRAARLLARVDSPAASPRGPLHTSTSAQAGLPSMSSSASERHKSDKDALSSTDKDALVRDWLEEKRRRGC